MRRVSRSTASQSHPLRARRPTKVHIPSSSSRGRRRTDRTLGALTPAFFRQLGYCHPGHARQAHDGPLRDAIGEQGLNLGVAGGAGRGGGREIALVITGPAAVLGPSTGVPFLRIWSPPHLPQAFISLITPLD